MPERKLRVGIRTELVPAVRRGVPDELLHREHELLDELRIAVGHASQLHAGVRDLLQLLRLVSDWLLPVQWHVQHQLRPVRVEQRDALRLHQDWGDELQLLWTLSGGLSRGEQHVQHQLRSLRIQQRDALHLLPGHRQQLQLLQRLSLRLLRVQQHLQHELRGVRVQQWDATDVCSRPDGQLVQPVRDCVPVRLARLFPDDQHELRGVRLEQRNAGDLRAELSRVSNAPVQRRGSHAPEKARHCAGSRW